MVPRWSLDWLLGAAAAAPPKRAMGRVLYLRLRGETVIPAGFIWRPTPATPGGPQISRGHGITARKREIAVLPPEQPVAEGFALVAGSPWAPPRQWRRTYVAGSRAGRSSGASQVESPRRPGPAQARLAASGVSASRRATPRRCRSRPACAGFSAPFPFRACEARACWRTRAWRDADLAAIGCACAAAESRPATRRSPDRSNQRARPGEWTRADPRSLHQRSAGGGASTQCQRAPLAELRGDTVRVENPVASPPAFAGLPVYRSGRRMTRRASIDEGLAHGGGDDLAAPHRQRLDHMATLAPVPRRAVLSVAGAPARAHQSTPAAARPPGSS